MSSWTAEELDRIGHADELQISAAAPDGTPGPFTTIWVVRVGDGLYVRSYRGRGAAWYRRVSANERGRIRVGGVERAVTFAPADPAVQRAIDEAYKSKYVVYADRFVVPLIAPDAVTTTVRLAPA